MMCAGDRAELRFWSPTVDGGESTRLSRAPGGWSSCVPGTCRPRVLPACTATYRRLRRHGCLRRPLAARRFRVHVVDPVPEHVAPASTLDV